MRRLNACWSQPVRRCGLSHSDVAKARASMLTGRKSRAQHGLRGQGPAMTSGGWDSISIGTCPNLLIGVLAENSRAGWRSYGATGAQTWARAKAAKSAWAARRRSDANTEAATVAHLARCARSWCRRQASAAAAQLAGRARSLPGGDASSMEQSFTGRTCRCFTHASAIAADFTGRA